MYVCMYVCILEIIVSISGYYVLHLCHSCVKKNDQRLYEMENKNGEEERPQERVN